MNANDYRTRVLNAFPSQLNGDVNVVVDLIFPKNSVWTFWKKNIKGNFLMHADEQIVLLSGEPLAIPKRVYFAEVDQHKISKLNAVQKAILNCIYLSHRDGYVRQRNLEQLIYCTDYFITPFTFQLLGSYVFEILEVLDMHIDGAVLDNYAMFINENPKYWIQTESRLITYWNEYYRDRFPQFRNYVGYRIIERINKHVRYRTS